MTNEDGLSYTRINQTESKIVNICKSCGESDYLFRSKKHRDEFTESEKKMDNIREDINLKKISKKPKQILVGGGLSTLLVTAPFIYFYYHTADLFHIWTALSFGGLSLLFTICKFIKSNNIRKKIMRLNKLNR